jgi:hypothetical protein
MYGGQLTESNNSLPTNEKYIFQNYCQKKVQFSIFDRFESKIYWNDFEELNCLGVFTVHVYMCVYLYLFSIYFNINPLLTVATFLGRFCLNLQGMWSMVKQNSTYSLKKNSKQGRCIFANEYFQVLFNCACLCYHWRWQSYNSA